MPTFEYTTQLTAKPSEVFEFIVRIRNLPRVMPPSPRIDVLKAPERLYLGAWFALRLKRFGFSRFVESEVTKFEEGRMFMDIQRHGPFRRFDHTHTVVPEGTGTRMLDHIEYEAPRRLIGLYLTNERIGEELASSFKFREMQIRLLMNV